MLLLDKRINSVGFQRRLREKSKVVLNRADSSQHQNIHWISS